MIRPEIPDGALTKIGVSCNLASCMLAITTRISRHARFGAGRARKNLQGGQPIYYMHVAQQPQSVDGSRHAQAPQAEDTRRLSRWLSVRPLEGPGRVRLLFLGPSWSVRRTVHDGPRKRTRTCPGPSNGRSNKASVSYAGSRAWAPCACREPPGIPDA